MIVMSGASYAQSYYVIVNEDNPISSLDKSELSDYFMKKTQKYPDGTRVLPVDQKGSSAVRKGFTSDVHNKTVTAVKSFWQQSVFQGRNTPPVEKSSDAAVIAYIANNPGAIGYVSSRVNVTGVKIVAVN